jgi:hypothetical protein
MWPSAQSGRITATSSSVQIAIQDGSGNIWFFQQRDGHAAWSAPRRVGFSNTNSGAQIAWTGVPGHKGTNSVIVSYDFSHLMFWYQNGGTWTEENVASDSLANSFADVAVTATNRGIVIVAARISGAFESWYQPYGSRRWVSDGSVGSGSGSGFSTVSATWDGHRVAVAAAYSSSGNLPNHLVFLWKSDGARYWSKQDIPGVTASQPLDGVAPSIAFTGFNLILGATQYIQSHSRDRLDFWWQGQDFTDFNLEHVAATATPNFYGPATLVSTHTSKSAGEVALIAPFQTTTDPGLALNDWTQPTGQTGWTHHTIAQP